MHKLVIHEREKIEASCDTTSGNYVNVRDNKRGL